MTEIPKSSPELLAFYREWLAWAESGAPSDKPFSRRVGLCTNMIYSQHIPAGERKYYELDRQLKEAFSDGRCILFGGLERYDQDARDGTMHLNPERLAWVRARIADCEDENHGS